MKGNQERKKKTENDIGLYKFIKNCLKLEVDIVKQLEQQI